MFDQGRVEASLAKFGTPEDIDYIVVSDGEEVQIYPFRLNELLKLTNDRFWVSATRALEAFSSRLQNSF